MDGSRLFGRKSTRNNKRKYRLWLKARGLNEHHRKPRNQNGGRGYKDLNISKVGIRVHQCFHTLFDVNSAHEVCVTINDKFPDASEYLVSVQTESFPIFHRYFNNRGVIEPVGMVGHGLTWGHLYLHCTEKDLRGAFKGNRHQYNKPDPKVEMTDDRWAYLFPNLSMPAIAYQLTKYWLPLDCVIVAIPKKHQVEVESFLFDIYTKKKRT